MKHYRYEREYPMLDGDKKITLIEFKEIRKTQCGYWIESDYSKDKFILKYARKKFAYPTKKEAFNSFKIRTNKSYGYAMRDLNNAKEFLQLIKEFDLTKLT